MTAKKKAAARKPARILAYLDPEAENKSLLDLLVRLVQHDGAEVLALSVLRELPWYARVGGGPSEKISRALERNASAALRKEVRPLVNAGVKVRTRVAWGRPFEVIIHEVLSKPTQLVLKTAHGEGRAESLLFGSTAMHLFRKCPVPVWVVRSQRATRTRRVLAAVNPMEPTSAEVDLNVEILRWAFHLAEKEDAELHVCHAYAIMGEHLLHDPTQQADYRAYVRDVVTRIETAMADLISGFGLALGDRHVHIQQGNAGEIIPALATQLNADVLIMGTIARAGVPGLLIGNTAEQMLRAVDCSVLALKPKGFISPVGLGHQAR